MLFVLFWSCDCIKGRFLGFELVPEVRDDELQTRVIGLFGLIVVPSDWTVYLWCDVCAVL